MIALPRTTAAPGRRASTPWPARPAGAESRAVQADAAIALVTPDDVGGSATKGPKLRRARQNVWLEIGWIWARLGRKRLLILVRGDVEFPSDLGGIEYQRYKSSPNERKQEIESLLKGVV